jgi:hypothetical protein
MSNYDASHFNPPAPVVMVTLFDPQSQAAVRDVPLLLDTGADVTLLPRGAVERLGVAVSVDRDHQLEGFDGSRSFTTGAVLALIFLGRGFHGRFLLIEEDSGILGRNVLNKLTLLLDGPRQQWSVHSP